MSNSDPVACRPALPKAGRGLAPRGRP